MRKSIDLNCDLGESYKDKKVGNDEAVFPFITSCNVACGAHGGDPATTEKTILLAIEHNLQIGAHPSYPDLAGFGRRKIDLSPSELEATIKAQISKIDDMSNSHGAQMKYVKAHGALYNQVNKDELEAEVLVQTIKALNSELAIMGQPYTILQEICEAHGMRYIREGFIDRLYRPDGSLTSRTEPGAVFEQTDELLKQFWSLVMEQKVTTATGEELMLEVDSLCVHGDNPHVVPFLEDLQRTIQQENIEIKKFDI